MDGEEVVSVQRCHDGPEAVDTGFPDSSLSADAQILSWFRSGQRDAAFAEIYRRHGLEIMNHANHILRNKHDAEEVTQETFLRALRDFASFQGASKVSTWLRRIADNLLIDRIRYGKRKGRDSVVQTDGIPENLAAPTLERLRPDFIAIQRERRLLVEQCAAALSETLQPVFLKRAFHEKTEQEVALELEVPVGTVKSRFNEARKRVAICLKSKTGGVI